MGYSLEDFINNLRAASQKHPECYDMQSEQAIDIIDQCLPKNIEIHRITKANITLKEVRL